MANRMMEAIHGPSHDEVIRALEDQLGIQESAVTPDDSEAPGSEMVTVSSGLTYNLGVMAVGGPEVIAPKTDAQNRLQLAFDGSY